MSVTASAGKTTIFLNNRDRSPEQDALVFKLELQHVLPNIQLSSYYLQVNSVTVEHLFQVIEFGINDQLWFEYSPGIPAPIVTYNILFNPGNYTIYDLMDAILAVLQPLDPTFDLDFDTEQFLLTLTVPVGAIFSLVRTNTNTLAPLQYQLSDQTDRTLELLGWHFDGVRYTIEPGEWTPINTVKVRNTCMLHFCVRQHIENSYSSDPTASDRILARIPIASDTTFGSVLHYQPTTPDAFLLSFSQGMYLEFYFIDEWGIQKRAGPGKNIVFGCVLSLIPIGNE